MGLDERLKRWGERARPVSTEPIDVRLERRPGRRIRLLVAVAAAVSVVTAGVIGGSQLFDGSEPGQAADATRPHTFHGLTVSVPESWPLNEMRCGTPVADTVILPGVIQGCLHPGPPHVSFVSFRIAGEITDATTTDTTIDGHQAIITSGTSTTPPTVIAEGDHVTRIDVPSLHTHVTIQSPDRATVDRIAGTARIVDQDANGCASLRNDLGSLPTGRPPVREGADSTLVPGSPTRVAFCRYGHDEASQTSTGIEQSVSVAGRDLVDVVAKVNTLPAGLSAPVSEGTCIEAVPPSGYTIVAWYADGPPVTVWVRLTDCELVGATNGSHNGQRTRSLIDLVTDRAGDAMGWQSQVRPVRVN